MTTATLSCARGADAPLDAIGAVRLAAWGPIVGPELAARRFGVDDHDRSAWHVMLTADERVVAAGRLVALDGLTDLPEMASFGPWTGSMAPPVGFASRLVVAPPAQGHGLGERIIVERLRLAGRLGVHQVWGETREHQIDGLARHGYRLLGPSTDESVPDEWHIMCAPLTDDGATALGP